MEVQFQSMGAKRKEMAAALGKALGGRKMVYLGAPSFAYKAGDYEIRRDGTLLIGDEADKKEAEQVLAALAKEGFKPEKAEPEPDNPLPEHPAAGQDGYSIRLPQADFTPRALENLDGLLSSKGGLIAKAFGIGSVGYTLEDGCITFSWLREGAAPELTEAFRPFIEKLCALARKQKRVSTKVKACENEKYAFRCFLLRLGFIGAEYKAVRKALLKNLSGNAAWKAGHGKEGGADARPEGD